MCFLRTWCALANDQFGYVNYHGCQLILFQGLNVDDVKVPVIGGHSGITILPLLSQVEVYLILCHAQDPMN